MNYSEIPQYLNEAGYALDGKCIAVVVPRRMAAISVAQRVAEEMGVKLGEEVGYSVRFDSQVSPLTSIKFITDGMLLREMMQDPLLTNYSVIMLDDIHERTSSTDLIFGLIKKIRIRRKQLKIIISSATLEAEPLLEFFQNEEEGFKAKILKIEGRLFPVKISYLASPCKNYVISAAKLALELHEKKPDGDILIFLTGQEEIQSCISFIEEYSNLLTTKREILLLPLYSNMNINQQMAIFNDAPYNSRKIIISTNLAESSVTINGIVYVIDSCFTKIKFYDYKTGNESLLVIPESQSSANQRSGRAGRVQEGESFRLCTKEAYEALSVESVPEVCRSNLSNILLQMKSLGIGNLASFDFLSPPPEENFVRSLELLYSLHAIDFHGNLTSDIGFKLAELPIDPRLGLILLNSCNEEYSCSSEILLLVSALSVQNIFLSSMPSGSIIKQKKKLGAKEGDHITFINILIRYKNIKSQNDKKGFCKTYGLNEKAIQMSLKIEYQLKKYLKKYKLLVQSCDGDSESIMKCVTTGFFDRVAQRQADGSYKSILNKQQLYLHPESLMNVVYPDWVIFHEVVKTTKSYMKQVSQANNSWLIEIAPHFYEDRKAKIIEEKRVREIENLSKIEVQTKKKLKTEKKNSKKPKSSFMISDMGFGDSD